MDTGTQKLFVLYAQNGERSKNKQRREGDGGLWSSIRARCVSVSEEMQDERFGVWQKQPLLLALVVCV